MMPERELDHPITPCNCDQPGEEQTSAPNSKFCEYTPSHLLKDVKSKDIAAHSSYFFLPARSGATR